ncbi:peptide ABC transporter substrate-binding protein [Oceanispirochaeta crateris]|uniref:Peptide ABC transporter substrate-binding protein n=1 Tax=Oceanispirochaeta crateris TaxID=2518645 RepID=A0A5C1QMM4_9SPIO|nr:peptide ABC transporter substrate-binding protein [Oceanispirochaeta crateris]QEN09313.1 peptide ABC transporter substrate-binding protein [Oceanispirochaeta crateris]
MQKKMMTLFLILFTLSGTFLSANDQSEFTINFSPSSISLNPQLGYTTAEAQIFTALYEGLVSYQPVTLHPEPGMAETWEISDDGLVYTFHLRDGLTWSNGDSLRASDIRTSWVKLLTPGKKADYASLLDVIKGARNYRTGKGLEKDFGVEVPDDQTLIVHLEKRVPYFLQILCHYSFVPIHPSLNDRSSWWDEETIPVNGPYRFSNKPGTNRMKLEVNPEYWDKEKVSINTLNIQFSEDSSELMEQFRLYEVDWVVSGWGSEKIDPDRLVLHPLFATSYFYFNNQEKPWNDPRVRTGLSLLLPWEKIRNSEYLPTSRLVPEIPDYPQFKGIEKEEVEKGLALLEEAGYPKGQGLPPIKIRVPYGDAENLKIMKESWETHLVTEVIIEEIPFPRYFSSLKEADYTLGQITWIGDYADPMTFLQMWQEGSSLNDASFSSEEYNRLLEEAVGEDRYKKMGEAEKLLLMTAQVLPLSHSPALNLIDLRFLEGWYPNVLDIHPFKYISFKNNFVIPGTI